MILLFLILVVASAFIIIFVILSSINMSSISIIVNYISMNIGISSRK